MKGVEFNIILVIIILSVLTVIAIAGYLYVNQLSVESYLSSSFEGCGSEIGSECCNMGVSGLEPFCTGGLDCDGGECVLVVEELFLGNAQYVYDDSCINGFVNGLDDTEGVCDVTALTRDFFVRYIRQTDRGLGTYDRRSSSGSLDEGMEECENVYECIECSKFNDFGEASDCTYCEYCIGNKCEECFECESAQETTREYEDCAWCHECTNCIVDDLSGIGECAECQECDACYVPTVKSEEAYCKEADICNDTTCFGNYICGSDSSNVDEDLYCKICKPRTSGSDQTICKERIELEICERVKNCLRFSENRDDICYLIDGDYASVIDHDSDLSRPFTTGQSGDFNWDPASGSYQTITEFLNLDIRTIISQCQAEDIYRWRTDQGMEQKVCEFKPPLMYPIISGGAPAAFSEYLEYKSRVYDSATNTNRYGEYYVWGPFLYDFPTPRDVVTYTATGSSGSYDSDLPFQDQKVIFNDCGNISGLDPDHYAYARSAGYVNPHAGYSQLFNYDFYFNDGVAFESNTMPEGRSIRLAISDIDHFDKDGENICDFNMYMCTQPMLVTNDNKNALNLQSKIRDIFNASAHGPEVSGTVVIENIAENEYEIDPMNKSRYNFEKYANVGDKFEEKIYFVTFDGDNTVVSDRPTFEGFDIGSEPMDAGHIANILMAGIRDWSMVISSEYTNSYDNLKYRICMDMIGEAPDLCNIDIRYDYAIPWDLIELDYSNVPSNYYIGTSRWDIRYGEAVYKECSKDLIGGACNSSHTDHPCWGWCEEHEYDLNASKRIRHIYTTIVTGRNDSCESITEFEFLDDGGKTVTSHSVGPHISREKKQLAIPNLPDKDGITKLEIKNDDCYVDFSDVSIHYDTLKDSEYSKNIYYIKTDDGLYRNKIDVYVGYIVKIYHDKTDEGRKVALVHPIVKFMQG